MNFVPFVASSFLSIREIRVIRGHIPRADSAQRLPYPSRLEIRRAAVGFSGGQFPVASGRWKRNKIFGFQRYEAFVRPVLLAQKKNENAG